MQNTLKVISSALFVLIPATALASPSISVTRTPSTGNVGEDYSVSWGTSGATKVGYRCSGAWNGNLNDMSSAWLGTSGTVTGKYDDTMIWSTTCVWTATDAKWTTATATETFSAKAKSGVPFESFAITKISWSAVSGSPVTLPKGSKSLVVEGVWAPGANVYVSSAGCVFVNQMANSDGTWSVTLQTNQSCKLPDSGAFQFSATASKAYYGEATRFATAVFPSATQVEMWKIECRTWKSYTETNFYATRGESVTCTVAASDPKTKLMMNSWYVTWWDIESSKTIEPKTVTNISTSCHDWVCSATFVSDYEGYHKTRHVWFENSVGKQSGTIAYGSGDPTSKDYADAVAYLKKKQNPSVPSTSSGGRTERLPWDSHVNWTLNVVSVTWAEYSNGKITAIEGKSFAIVGTATKRSQLRIYRKWWDSDGVSAGSDESGKWSFYNLSWYPRVFKTGTHQYVVESVSSDGKFKSAITVEIEIVPANETKSNPTSSQGSASTGKTSNGNSSSTSGGPAKPQPSAPKISSALKIKLDSFVSLLEEKARAKWDTKASSEYVWAVRTKLRALHTRYRKADKTASAAAIEYIIERTDEVYEKFAQPLNEEESLIKDLKESY